MRKKIVWYIKYSKEYGIKCLFATILANVVSYKRIRSDLSWRILQYKNKVIIQYLFKYYKEYTGDCSSNIEAVQCEKYIWTAWLQGEEQAPEVIQMTLSSIKKNSNGCKVIVLTRKNIREYVDVPSIIEEKHRNGIIGYAHYTDIVRMLVLKEYGGLWLDATMFLAHEVDCRAFKMPFYSVGINDNKRTRFVANHKWIIGIIGGERNSRYLSQIAEMMVQYWKEHEMVIDYFVFDYLIMLLYNKDRGFASIIESLPQVNNYPGKLREEMNQPYSEKVLQALLSEKQPYYLSYKYKYHKTTIDGQTTNYGYLLHLFEGDR